MLGHERLGTGPRRAIVLNDWMGDTSSWDPARPYLDTTAISWAFADLRGYGRSREQRGDHTVTECAADVLALADALGWDRFAVVGHSMSSLVALHLAQHAPERIERAVALTPPPPRGFGVDDATLAAMQAVATGDDARRRKMMQMMWGARLTDAWIAFKAARWRETSMPAAVAAFVPMFARDGMPDPTRAISVPVLAVTGEHDGEPMRARAVEQALAPFCPQLEVRALTDSGHYPMQEVPPLLVAIVERFLTAAR